MKIDTIATTIAAMLGVGMIGGATVATAADADSRTRDMICHPVEGAGETGNGWNLISPDQASAHIDEVTGEGKHTRKDGRTDVYLGDDLTCPGEEIPEEPTDTPTTEVPTEQPTTTPPVTEPPVDPTRGPDPSDGNVTIIGQECSGETCTSSFTQGYPQVEVNCSAHQCTKTTKNSETGEVIDHEVITYPTNAIEEGY